MAAKTIDFQEPAIRDLCRRYPVRKLEVFGSALRSDFAVASDVDFVVEFLPEARVGFMTLSRMQRDLAEILQRRVDLVTKSGLKTLIRQSVLASARVIYEA